MDRKIKIQIALMLIPLVGTWWVIMRVLPDLGPVTWWDYGGKRAFLLSLFLVFYQIFWFIVLKVTNMMMAHGYSAFEALNIWMSNG